MPAAARSAVTLGDLIDTAETRILRSRRVDLWRPWVARMDAEELAGIVLGRPIAAGDAGGVPTAAQRRRYRVLTERRAAGEPMAIIRGSMEFAGLRLMVRRGVFSPRPSSELLAAEAIRRLRRRHRPVSVDIATGAGPVALAVAASIPHGEAWGVDIAPAAVRLARANARALRLANARFRRADLLRGLPRDLRGRVNVFTIHPPYVASRHVRTLPPEIRDFEPPESLSDRSGDGLGLVRRLAGESPEWLARGGWVLVEVSPDLARSVAAILRGGGFAGVRSHRDRLGVTRVVAGAL